MKNRAIVLFLGIHLFLTATLLWAGGETDVGNGGDVVYCAKSTENAFEGYYSLDYVLTYKSGNNNADIVQVVNARASLEKMLLVLKSLKQNETEWPEETFTSLFEDFVKNIGNEDNYKSKRIWDGSIAGVITVNDESLVKKIPKNCQHVIQTVVRQTKLPAVWGPVILGDLEHMVSSWGFYETKLTYTYDSKILGQLTELQKSFLWVHEFFWDIAHSAQDIRRMNRFFHSQKFYELKPEDLKANLEGLGITVLFGDPREKSTDVRYVCQSQYLKRSLGYSGPIYSVEKFMLKGGRLQDLWTEFSKNGACNQIGRKADDTYFCEVQATIKNSCTTRF